MSLPVISQIELCRAMLLSWAVYAFACFSLADGVVKWHDGWQYIYR
jgi:hypothetical protein